MRIYIQTTSNRENVPFNYQPALVGALHKWLSLNAYHDDLSLYSLSWLSRGKATKQGLSFPRGSRFFVSAPDIEFVKKLIGGIQRDPNIAFGMKVLELTMRPTPEFESQHTFNVQSPVLIKRKVEEGIKFYFREDAEADTLLTETLAHKLKKGGLGHLSAEVKFDQDYLNPKTKVAMYKGIKNKGTVCPISITGDPEAIAFAWEVGIGNSTGIGFGALK